MALDLQPVEESLDLQPLDEPLELHPAAVENPTPARALAYGPIVGEHSHDTLFGPLGNALGPQDVALSPNLLKSGGGQYELGQSVDAHDKAGNYIGRYRVADTSYFSPGKPTSDTIEFRDRDISNEHVTIQPADGPPLEPQEVSGDNFDGQVAPENVASSPVDMPPDISAAAVTPPEFRAIDPALSHRQPDSYLGLFKQNLADIPEAVGNLNQALVAPDTVKDLVLKSPAVKLARFAANLNNDPAKTNAVIDGTASAVGETASGLTKPENIAIIGALAGTPALISKAVSLGFSAQAAASVYQKIQQLNAGVTDLAEKSKLIVGAIIEGAIATAAGKHGLNELPKTVRETFTKEKGGETNEGQRRGENGDEQQQSLRRRGKSRPEEGPRRAAGAGEENQGQRGSARSDRRAQQEVATSTRLDRSSAGDSSARESATGNAPSGNTRSAGDSAAESAAVTSEPPAAKPPGVTPEMLSRAKLPANVARPPRGKAPKAPKVEGGFGDAFDEMPLANFVRDEVGGVLSKSAARKKRGAAWYKENKSLWDNAPEFSDIRHSGKIYNTKTGVDPDKAASAAADAGLLPEGADADVLWSALQKESDGAVSMNKQRKDAARNVALDEGEAGTQQHAFQAAAASIGKGEFPVRASDLKVGDVVSVNGTDMKVTEVGDTITLEDGKTYGIQHVENGTVFYGRMVKEVAGGRVEIGKNKPPVFKSTQSAGGKNFTQSAINYPSVEAKYDPQMANKILTGWKKIKDETTGFVSWDRMAKETGIPVEQIASVVKAVHKERPETIGFSVDRMGNATYFKIRKPSEFIRVESPSATPIVLLSGDFSDLRVKIEAEGTGWRATLTDSSGEVGTQVYETRQAALDDFTTPQGQFDNFVEAPLAPPADAPPATGLPEGFVSVGASTGADITPGRVMSIKNAEVDRTRTARGWLPLFEPARRAMGKSWDEAMERLDKRPSLGEEMVDDIRAGRKDSVSATESAILLHEQIRIHNDKIQEAERAADPTLSQEDRDYHLARSSALEDRMNEIDQATQAAGTMTARALQIRNLMAKDDFTLLAMEARTRIAKGGESLTPDESADIQKQFTEIVKLDEKADETEGKRDEEAAGEGVKRVIVRVRVKRRASDDLRDLEEERGDLVDGMGERLAAGDKPEQLGSLVRRLAENFVLEGIRDREELVDAVHGELLKILPDITRRQTMDAISGYGDFKELNPNEVKATLRDIKGQLQQVAKIEDMMAKQAPKKTGVERRSPSDEERRLIKRVNELKKEGGWNVTDPAKALQSALDAVKTRLRNQISDYSHQIATRTKIVAKRGTVKLDPEAAALKQIRDGLKAQYDQIFGKPGMSDAQRVKLATDAAKRSIAEYERRIKEGDFSARGRGTLLTPELTQLRAERTRLHDEYKALESAVHPERKLEAELRTYKARLNNMADNYEKRLARGDFAPPEPRPRIKLDREAEEARYRAEKAKRNFNAGLIKYRNAQQGLPTKIGRNAGEVANYIKALRSSVDLSAVRRQGGALGSAHPLLAAQSFGPMFKAFRSEAGELALQEAMIRHPLYPIAIKAGLQITKEGAGAKLSDMEEQYMSRWARSTPLVAGSERAYVTYLNELRFKSFIALRDSVSRSWLKSGNVTAAEEKAIANFVNKATGRGSFGTKDAVTGGLSTVFWSPRLVASRFQMIMGQPFYRGTARTRLMIAREYGRMLVGQSVYYGLLGAAFTALGYKVSVNTDSKSSDFLKIRVGDKTRIDPFFGLIQPTVLVSRLISGEKTTASGKTQSIRGDKLPFGVDATDLLKDFARTKLAPVPGLILDAYQGRDYAGQPVTLKGIAADAAVPLSLADIYGAMRQEGVPTGMALGLVSTFGDGVQSYSPRVPETKSGRTHLKPAF